MREIKGPRYYTDFETFREDMYSVVIMPSGSLRHLYEQFFADAENPERLRFILPKDAVLLIGRDMRLPGALSRKEVTRHILQRIEHAASMRDGE